MAKVTPDTRQQILSAALKRFAEQGYAGTSVQQIVEAAGVTKPALYYHFRNKAGLFRALVDWAHEERYRLMQQAVARGGSLAAQLTEICAVLFDFIQDHRSLVRLAFATAFAAPGEVPPEAKCLEKGWRNFEFLHQLLRRAAERGEISRAFTPRELAMGFAGMMNLHVLAHLIRPNGALDRRQARRIVELFLTGAAPGPETARTSKRR